MDYIKMSHEYHRDAENLLKTIKKYESMLSSGNSVNLEAINFTIANYRSIYNYLLNIANELETKGKRIAKK